MRSSTRTPGSAGVSASRTRPGCRRRTATATSSARASCACPSPASSPTERSSEVAAPASGAALPRVRWGILGAARIAMERVIHATFTCATQLSHHQWVDLHGTKGRIGIEMPWSMPDDRPSRLLVDDGLSLTKDTVVPVTFPACNQWVLQAELFSRAIQDGGPAPIPIEDAVATMQVIDAIFRSAKSGRWEIPDRL